MDGSRSHFVYAHYRRRQLFVNFFDLNLAGLESWCLDHDLPKFTAKQLRNWIWKHGVLDPEDMTNVSARARVAVREELTLYESAVVTEQHASDGTQKLLTAWPKPDQGKSLPILEASRTTECVMIPTEARRTACVSSQIGCPVGCKFCATGLGGHDGNLTAGQIVEQVHRLSHLGGGRITNLVFMGMGEPLANYQAVTEAIRLLHEPDAAGLGARRITISTVGLPPAIRKLLNFEIPVKLALSLHAPTDDLRRELIPWAAYSTIDELLDACSAWFDRTGREITLEYVLLAGVNDQPEHAHALVDVVRRLRGSVNLLRWNEVEGLPYQRPTDEAVIRFQRVLKQNNINAIIRKSRGRDIAAACGQLKHESKHSA